MRNSLHTRKMIKVGLAAAIIGIVGEFYIRPMVSKAV